MNGRIVFAPARPASRAAIAIAALAAFALAATFGAAAQQTTPAPGPAPAAPKPHVQAKPKKPATPAPADQAPAQPPAQAPAQAPAQPPAPDQTQAAAPAQPQMQLVYSPWTKICGKDQQQANAKEVCLVIKEARLETGQFVAGAVLVEPEGETRKILRVTLPLGMHLQQGTRVIVDQGTPTQRPYATCVPNGCLSDYEVDADMVGKLKKGQSLVIQAIFAGGQPLTLQMPLLDFAKAYDGPPTDPKVLEEQQKKLQEELQHRAEEARKKLEGQQPPAGQPGASAAPPPTK